MISRWHDVKKFWRQPSEGGCQGDRTLLTAASWNRLHSASCRLRRALGCCRRFHLKGASGGAERRAGAERRRREPHPRGSVPGRPVAASCGHRKRAAAAASPGRPSSALGWRRDPPYCGRSPRRPAARGGRRWRPRPRSGRSRLLRGPQGWGVNESLALVSSPPTPSTLRRRHRAGRGPQTAAAPRQDVLQEAARRREEVYPEGAGHEEGRADATQAPAMRHWWAARAAAPQARAAGLPPGSPGDARVPAPSGAAGVEGEAAPLQGGGWAVNQLGEEETWRLSTTKHPDTGLSNCEWIIRSHFLRNLVLSKNRSVPEFR